MAEYKTVTPHELKHWLDNNEAVVVDVREPAEYANLHIPGSTLIPLGEINNDKVKSADLGNKKLVIHCQLGKRGGMACQKLVIENPELEVYNLEGGITAWADEGYPTKKA